MCDISRIHTPWLCLLPEFEDNLIPLNSRKWRFTHILVSFLIRGLGCSLQNAKLHGELWMKWGAPIRKIHPNHGKEKVLYQSIPMTNGFAGVESVLRLSQSKVKCVRHRFTHMIFAFQLGYAVMVTCYIS